MDHMVVNSKLQMSYVVCLFHKELKETLIKNRIEQLSLYFEKILGMTST